eukprot:Selendium_serpulae@DN10181_c0_g1_i1.p1
MTSFVSVRMGSKTSTKTGLDNLWALAHLGQSRFLPPPSFRTSEAKVCDFVRGVTSDPGSYPEGRGYDLGKIVGRAILHYAEKQNKTLLQHTHLSLSNGSCWESSRAELGKWSIVKDGAEFSSFLESRVCESFRLSEEIGAYVDPLGNKVADERDGTHQVWRIAYHTTLLSGELGERYSVEGTLEEMIFSNGFDARMGQLLHCWSCIKHEEWKKNPDPLKAKLIIVTEPGGKIRPLTSGEVWAYV